MVKLDILALRAAITDWIVCLFGVNAPTLDSKVSIESDQFFLRILLSLREVAGKLIAVAEVLASPVVEDALADGSVTVALSAAITSLLRVSSSASTDIMVLKTLCVLTAFLSFFFQ